MFPLDAFHCNRRHRDGLDYTCKSCNAERARLYNIKHPDRVKAHRRKWVVKNKARVLAYARQNSHKYRHKRGKVLGMWISAKSRAKLSGIAFNIEISDVVIPAFCPVLRIAIDQTLTRLAPSSPTLDRVNPSKGYVKGNVRVISWRANRIKSDATADELEAIALSMREHERAQQADNN